MPNRLQHEFPRWEPMDDGEPRELWRGHMHVVSPKRARVLRKRGVPLMPLHRGQTVETSPPTDPRAKRRHRPTSGDRARYAWFEPTEHAEARQGRRRLRCYLVATRPQPFGRKGWLRERLASHRATAQSYAYFRALAVSLYGRYTMPPHPDYERAGLYAGVIHENVLNPQLDLYAKAFAAMQIETATGAALDALCGVPRRPADMSDAELRTYAQQGYLLRVEDMTPEQRAQRGSPPLTLYVPARLQREDENDREFVQRHLAAGNIPAPPTICPTCEGDPVALDGSICGTCDGACTV